MRSHTALRVGAKGRDRSSRRTTQSRRFDSGNRRDPQIALGARRTGQEWWCTGHYYFHSDRIPLYLLTVFGKGEKADLSKGERNELAKLVDVLKRYAEEDK